MQETVSDEAYGDQWGVHSIRMVHSNQNRTQTTLLGYMYSSYKTALLASAVTFAVKVRLPTSPVEPVDWVCHT